MDEKAPCSVVERAKDRDAITFTGKLKEPMHNWFRLTASFSPAYVRETIKEGRYQSVLDPFSGVGTTVLEARKLGVHAVAVELNPFLQLVGNTKARVRLSHAERAKALLPDVSSYYAKLWPSFEVDSLGAFLAGKGAVPALSNIERWWTWENLRQVLCMKQAIERASEGEASEVRGLFVIALAKAAMAASNAGAGRVSLSFLERTTPKVDLAARFSETVKKMAIDVTMALPEADAVQGAVFAGDSTRIADFLPKDFAADGLITSPPYPNRFTYTRETRPMLYLFDFFSQPMQAGELDCVSLGGTWGRAWTYVSQTDARPANKVVADAMGDVVGLLDHADPDMRSYCTKYFNDLERNVMAVKPFLNDGAHLHYVVGNSYLKGVEIPTDLILARIFDGVGLEPVRIERLRKRQSRRGLYEAVVVAKK